MKDLFVYVYQGRSGTLRYELQNVGTFTDSTDYFVINPQSGEIIIAKSLAEDTARPKRTYFMVRTIVFYL